MSKLQQVQEKAQKVAEAIATVLNMEVEIVDTDLVRVAGTGKVKNDIGRRLLRGFINKHVLRTGQHVFIGETGHHEICSSCPLYGNCYYLASVVHPIFVEDELIGNISLIAFDEKQKQIICGHEHSLVEFLSRMAEFISVKVSERQMIKEKTVLANRLQAVIDSVHEGVLATDQNGVVTHFNRSGEVLLGLTREQVIGSHIGDKMPAPFEKIIAEAKEENDIAAREIFLNLGNKKLHLLVTVRAIASEGEEDVGAVASFRDFGETEKLAYESLHRWETFTFDDIIGDSEVMLNIKKKAHKVARGSSSVLIVGKSGTGKELFARAIHSASSRKDKAFVAINCGAIPETLLESEFFGYEEGAFTGAKRGGKLGKFELAHGGTLFLDEISSMSLYLQAKLLRVLQERQIEKVGGTDLIPVDLRIVAATNTDLHELVTAGRFRDDLFYRLSVIPLLLPPLCERGDDILQLLEFYMKRFAQLFDKDIKWFTKEALDICLQYPWPGNVRELVNTVEYAINLEESNYIRAESLPARIRDWQKPRESNIQLLRTSEEIVPLPELEKMAIKQALDIYGWTEEGKQSAAEALGISRATIYRRIQKYKLIQK